MRTRAAFAVLMAVVFVVPGAGDASAQSAGLGAGGSRGGAGLSAGGSAGTPIRSDARAPNTGRR